jgi:hypothetical protein
LRGNRVGVNNLGEGFAISNVLTQAYGKFGQIHNCFFVAAALKALVKDFERVDGIVASTLNQMYSAAAACFPIRHERKPESIMALQEK